MRAWAVALLMLASPSLAQAQTIQTVARVIATGDVDGRFSHPVCVGRDLLRPSDHAAFTYALAREAALPDQPMVVDTGGLISPHGVSRFAAANDPESLATMIDSLGYRALALGVDDLSAPRQGVIDVARELRERDIPMLASNLRCAESAAAFCEQLVDGSDGPSMHLVGGQSTAVLSVLRQNATDLVEPDRAAGIVMDPPKESVERLTRIARELGADIVIAVVDQRVEGGAIEFAASLDPDARPDLILVTGREALLFARPRTVRPVLVGTPGDDAIEIRIRESQEIRQGYEMLAQPLGGRGVTVARPVLEWIDRIEEPYCEAWGRPLPGASLEEELDVAGMIELAGRIARERTGADLAILARDALDPRWRPSQPGALTASDIYIALQYDNPLQVTDVDQAWLVALSNSADNHNLSTTGLTWTGTGSSRALKIGGHAADARARYRVVTVHFLAAGGYEAVPALTGGREWEYFEDHLTLRDAVLEYLEVSRSEDPRDTLPQPNESVEWTFRANADLTFSGATAQNPRQRCIASTPPAMCVGGLVVDAMGATSAAYAATQLSSNDLITFGLNVDLAFSASAPDWQWLNTGTLLYRTAWIEPSAASQGGFVEAADQIRLRSNLSWRGLRQGTDQWYLPDPTLGVFIETELTEVDSRGWHWFLTRPMAGLRFQLLDKLTFQINGGFEAQPFDPNLEVEPGIGATLTLQPWDIMRVGSQFFRWSFTFDYFLADLGDQYRGALRGLMEAAFDLFGPLALTFRLNVIVEHQAGQDVGTAMNVTTGLRVGYIGRTFSN